MQMLNRLATLLHNRSNQPNKQPPQITIETAVNVLSAQRRRYVIDYLCTEEASTTLRELSEYIATQENSDRKTVHIALYQQHIPTLFEAGIVTWNQRAGTITATQTCTVLHNALSDLESRLM